jgi:adenylate cyclase
VYRHVAHFTKYGQHLYPSLSLSPFLTDIQLDFNGIEHIGLTLPGAKVQRRISFDSDHKSYINMYGKFEAYSFGGVYLSLMKIDQGLLVDLPISPEVFRGKTVFIGASASGVKDLKHTALGPQTPGVFLHASAYGNIISDDFLRFSPAALQPISMAVMVALSVTAFFLLDSLLLKILLPLSTLILWELAAIILFAQNISFPMAGPVIAVFCTYLVSLSFLSVTEGRERRKIKNVLGQYVAPSVLSKVLENPSEEFMRAEVGSKEELSIFFSDIRGFTTIAECHPAEKVVELLNNYLSAMTAIIFDKHGTLDKFIGDAIVAFWGAPLRDNRHPYRAVQSAVEMQHVICNMNQKNKDRNLPQLHVGIAIHTDHVILGNIGSHRRLDYTVIGDGVNLASRLEGLTKMYNTPILISQSTYDRVKDDFCCRVVDYVKVKGKQKPIRIYSVLGTASDLDSDILKIINLTDRAFDKYVHRNFRQAETILTQILTLRPKDYLTTLLLFRCREYQLNPPPESWDGYFEYQTK